MNNRRLLAPAELELLLQIEALLADPAHRDNPLRPALASLFEYSEGQRERLERLVRISDGYHVLSRQDNQTLAEQYDKQLRRLEKLARISDRYQNGLREMSEALKDAAFRDPLTGLGNRRLLMERLREETKRANRKQAPYALGVLDVDHFKAINDGYGHDIGDKVLGEIGAAIQTALREYDLCGRWGGEEFLIVLPETSLEFARQVAERVLEGIRQISVALPEGRLPAVSASLGLTVYALGEAFAETLNRADMVLLEAKAGGRDRIAIA